MDFKIFRHKKFSEIRISCTIDEVNDSELEYHQLYVCKSEDGHGYDVGQLLIIPDGKYFGNKLAWFPHLKDAIGECESMNSNFIHPLRGWCDRNKVYHFKISDGFDKFGNIVGSGRSYEAALIHFCSNVTKQFIDSSLR